MSFFWSTVISVALSFYLVSWSTTAAEAIRNSVATCHDASDSSEEVVGSETAGSSRIRNEAQMTKSNLAIEIDGETYRLDELPVSESGVVVSNKNRILEVEFKILINSVGRLGVLVNLAYNGAVAAGPKYIDIQLDIQTIGHSLADVFDESVLTVSEFKRSSERVLAQIPYAFDFLLNNREKLAIEKLTSTLEVAKHMEQSAKQLQKLNKIDEFIDFLNKTLSALNIEDEPVPDEEEIDTDDEDEDLISKISRYVSCIVRSLMKLINMISSFVGVPEVFSEYVHSHTAESKMMCWKNQHKEPEQRARPGNQFDYGKQNLTFSEKMTEFAKKTKDGKGEDLKNMLEAAIEILSEAIGIIKRFWKNVEQHCKFLASDELINKIKHVIDTSEDENHQKEWTSNDFKFKAIYIHAGWKAVRDVYHENLVEHIKLTRKELHKMMVANPTREESLENIKSLAKKLLQEGKDDTGRD